MKFCGIGLQAHVYNLESNKNSVFTLTNIQCLTSIKTSVSGVWVTIAQDECI